MNFHPKYYDDPEKFNPNRWIGSDAPTKKLDSFVFTPFSAGPRNCLGQHLAMIETKIILIKLLQKFDFKLCENYKMKWGFKGLYEPVDPILLDLKTK